MLELVELELSPKMLAAWIVTGIIATCKKIFGVENWQHFRRRRIFSHFEFA
jgi:hypothetical protein